MAFKSRLVYYQARFGVAILRTKKINRVGNRHKIKTCLQISCANEPKDSIDIFERGFTILAKSPSDMNANTTRQ